MKRILVAVDGSRSSKRAVIFAAKVANATGGYLLVVHVIPKVSYGFVPVPTSSTILPTGFRSWERHARKHSQNIVDNAVSSAEREGAKVKKVLLETFSSTAEGIVSWARRDKADLIVIGTRGLGRLRGLLLGSVSTNVIAQSQCPVVAVK